MCASNPTPVRSNYGTINFSSDYAKMLILIGTSTCQGAYPLTDPNRQNSGTAYILSINRQTGGLVQQKAWFTRANDPVTDPNPRTAYIPYNAGYSADFSPDGNFVYVTQLYPGWLTRYDVTVADPGTTQYTIGPISRGTPVAAYGAASGNTWNGGGQVRRGPDGRMYISSNPYTGTYPVPAAADRNQIICITKPDVAIYASASQLGWQNPCQGVNLGTAHSWYGLPQMVTVYVPEVIYY